ncbi:hypothetical protein [Desulfotruncus alcoholivorax]|uniref:hypothetical protein n=1 Tax=Desulfotruncus alcoholivorax TaxID=265477 RepID=UPI00040D70B2|nr:hypothetical protein [Desulfotruncus alcoholivorax]
METRILEDGIPTIQPVTGLDRINYLYKYGHSNIQIQAVIAIDQHLDADVLKKAVRHPCR